MYMILTGFLSESLHLNPLDMFHGRTPTTIWIMRLIYKYVKCTLIPYEDQALQWLDEEPEVNWDALVDPEKHPELKEVVCGVFLDPKDCCPRPGKTRQPDMLRASLQARADTVFISRPTKKVPFKVEAMVDDWKHPEQQLYFSNFD